MKHLIINADDFGIHKSVNLAIVKGFKEGCITSTSLMPSGNAFEHAMELASRNTGLGIGVHLTLVGEQPVSDRDTVRSLVDEDGYFAGQYPTFLMRYLLGMVKKSEIRREFTAQISKVLRTGVKITHLDSHQHLHILPGIIEIVIDIAREFDIKAIRIPDEPYLFTGGYPFKPFRMAARAGLTFLARRARCTVKKHGIKTPSHFFGMLAGGNMQENYLRNIVENLPDGVSEIMVHPGLYNADLESAFSWNYHWGAELKALTSTTVLDLIDIQRIQMISFGELTHD